MDDDLKEVESLKVKKNLFQRFLKLVFYLILSIIALNGLLYILLSIPSIQQWAVNFALSKIKPIVKTEITIDEVRLRLFNHVNLKGIYVESQTQDTLLYVGELDVTLNLCRLFNNELGIDGIQLDNAIVNITQETSQSPFNFQFLIDAFASDSTEQDTTGNALKVVLESIKIKNAKVKYDILSEAKTPNQFNPSHLFIDNLNADLSLPSIDISGLDISVNSLSFVEQSGFILDNINAKVHSKGTLIWTDNIELKLPNSDLQIKDLKYNLLNNEFSLKASSQIAVSDILSFEPNLVHLTNDLSLKTSVSGRLPAIEVNSLQVSYGDEMDLLVQASISDYTHYEEANINLAIDRFMISPKAISDFAKIGDPQFILPDITSALHYLRLKGTFKGTLDKMVLNTDLWTNQGTLNLSGNVSVDTTFQNFNIDANLQALNLNLAVFAGRESGLGRISMHTNFKVRQQHEVLTAQVRGSVDALQYNKTTLKNINFRADYTPQKASGNISVNLPIAKVLAEASVLQGKTPKLNFDLKVDDLVVDKFYDNPSWINPLLSLHLYGNIAGTTLDDIEGRVTLDSLNLSGDNFKFQPDRINLEVSQQIDNSFLKFTSSILEAKIIGEYQLSKIVDEFTNLMNLYLPDFFEKNTAIKKRENNFKFNILVHNTENLSNVFELPVQVMNTIGISGTINTVDSILNIQGVIPCLKFGEFEVDSTMFEITNTDNKLKLVANTIIPQGEDKFKFNLNTDAKSDTLNLLLAIKNTSSTVSVGGDINTFISFDRNDKKELTTYLNFRPTVLNVDNFRFSILPASIVNTGDVTSISNFGFKLNDKKYFDINGIVSDSNTDSLKIHFDHAQLGDILTAFDIDNIKAEADGRVVVTNVLQHPELYTYGFKLKDIVVFGDTLGTLNLESEWNNDLQAVKFDASLLDDNLTSKFGGYYYVAQDSIDMKIGLDRFSLNWMQPFLSDVLNRMSGSISTGLSLKGRLDSPVIEGWLGVNDTYLGVDFTNVTYHISDTIRILPDKIGFENLLIEDDYKNKATASAVVTHHNFEDIQYLLTLNLDKFMILNTENNTDSLFHGKLFTSGKAQIKGNDNGVDINLKIKNDGRSAINVLIPQTSDATTYRGIVYINTPTPEDNNLARPTVQVRENPLPMKLGMDLELTPDLSFGVVINPAIGDAMQVKGAGLIKFNYDLQSEDMKAFGDYTLSDGSVHLKLQFKSVDFRIREGSRLMFIGDPMKTNFDIEAFHRVRADLSTLDPSFLSNRIPVDCILKIKGNIEKMDLSYDIALPESSDDTKAKVRSLIVTNEQKIRQFAYLIATGTFQSDAGGGANMGSGMWTNLASDALSKGLESLFGNILGDKWEIGTDISSANGSFSDMDMRVNVSTKLFDDKLKLNTNVGYRSGQSADSEQLIGDFDIQYQLSRTVKLKAYSQTNDRLYRTAPITQGIGLVYTREAKTLRELVNSFF